MRIALLSSPKIDQPKIFRPELGDPGRPVRGLDDEALRGQTTIYRDDMLAGQTILISGAGSGMGKAAAFLAASLGAKVAICGRDLAKLEGTASLIRDACQRDILCVAANIRDADAVEAMISKVHDHYGALDTLVNNAGGQFPQDAIDFSRKGWLASMSTWKAMAGTSSRPSSRLSSRARPASRASAVSTRRWAIRCASKSTPCR